MRRPWRLRLLSVAFLLAATGMIGAGAGEDKAARALVEKAIQAHGGEAALTKLPAVEAKLKGKISLLGEATAFTGDFAADGPERQKVVIEGTLNGEKFRMIHVVNGAQAWLKTGDEATELTGDDFDEALKQAQSTWVATLIPLKDRAFKLTSLGEFRIQQRPVLGVRVAHKGQRDVQLFFDQQTGLLVKTKVRVKDESGEEITEESYLDDYRDVQGTKQATKLLIKHDGEMFMEAEVSDYQLSEKLDKKVFGKP
jgi:hypothetical protein